MCVYVSTRGYESGRMQPTPCPLGGKARVRLPLLGPEIWGETGRDGERRGDIPLLGCSTAAIDCREMGDRRGAIELGRESLSSASGVYEKGRTGPSS